MTVPQRVLCLLLLLSLIAASSQDEFSRVGSGYVPKGKPLKQSSLRTREQCESACAAYASCKAYAFRTLKPACYFYSEVFMGGTPKMGLYGSGLSIVPKEGFTSAFKRSSFPSPPVFSK